MRHATLLFLIKKSDGKITDILLAMKKRSFGVGRWNGAGGKVVSGESVEDATIRETKEEIGVDTKNMEKVAELSFTFAHNADWNQQVHTYFCENWTGTPTESEEMRPQWFKTDQLPFAEMWPDDPFWIPQVIEGKKIKASFTFGEGDSVLERKVEEVATI